MCLSDNVVVAEDIAVRVIMQLLSLVRVHGCSDPVGVAVKRLALSRWGVLCEHLVAQEFEKRLCCPEETGILYCLIAGIRAEQQMQSPSEWASACTILLRSPSQAVAIGAAMATVYLAYNGKASFETGLADALLALLQRGAAAAHAAAWALVWLGDPECFGAGPWIPTEAQLSDCIRRLSDPTLDACAAYYLTCLFRRHCSPFAIHVLIQELQHASADVRRSSAIALRKTRHPDAVEHLCAALADPAPSVRIVVAESLGAIGDIRAVEFLVARLSDDNREVRRAVAYALGHLGSEPAQEVLRRNLSSEDEYARKDALGALSLSCRTELDRMLLSRDFDGFQPFLDPSCPINEERIREAAKECLLSIPEVRERYWSIASRLQLSSMLPIGDTGAATTVSCLN
jgi:HEAT repeat protein